MPTLVVNPLSNGTRKLDETFEFSESFELVDPRDPIKDGFLGFEVLTAKDGGKRLVWRSDDFAQLLEAKKKFNEMLASGMVAFFVDPDNGKPDPERVMELFTPEEGQAYMEDITKAHEMINKINKTVVTPIKHAVGG